MAEGYVKYTASHTPAPALAHPLWAELNEARTRLHDLGLLGIYPDGIGFGNVSIRLEGDRFLITGTATGAPRELSPGDYCLVSSVDITRNRIVSSGPVKASSESMTHGAIYQACPRAMCVLHIHCREIFDGMLRDGCLSTPAAAEYGTPAMARAIAGCAGKGEKSEGSIVLAGHDEGVIAYGPSVERALELVLALYHTYKE
jgi:ribulose-5-phosphate 4-epimerase/fuculose-1-phosphate aldolase